MFQENSVIRPVMQMMECEIIRVMACRTLSVAFKISFL